MFQALRIRDFRLLWGAGLISSLGSWLLVIAIPAHILVATGSLRDTGLAIAAQDLPMLLLGLVAGVLADRLDRRRVMIAANVWCSCAVATMPFGISPARYWVLYVAIIAESSGSVLSAPATQARIPAIVGTGQLLTSANALTSATRGTVGLIGGPAGGVLLAVLGVRWLICADSVSYLLAAAGAFLTSRPGGARDRTALGVRDLTQGACVLRAHAATRALLPVTIIFLAANASLDALLIPLGIRRLGGTGHTGILLSCLGAGFLLGAPALRALLDRIQPRDLMTAALTVTAGGFFVLFTSSSLASALPAAAAIGTAGSMALVIPQITMGRVIPGEMLGRATAIFLTSQSAVTLLGALAGLLLAQAAGLTVVAAVAATATLGAAVMARLTIPRMPAVA